MVLVKSIVNYQGGGGTYPYWGSFDTLNEAKKQLKNLLIRFIKKRKILFLKKLIH